MKAFFVKFAKSRGLDPLVPETWYAISRKEVKDEKVFAFIVAFSTYILFGELNFFDREGLRCWGTSLEG